VAALYSLRSRARKNLKLAKLQSCMVFTDGSVAVDTGANIESSTARFFHHAQNDQSGVQSGDNQQSL
jgi:hypothetical protein